MTAHGDGSVPPADGHIPHPPPVVSVSHSVGVVSQVEYLLLGRWDRSFLQTKEVNNHQQWRGSKPLRTKKSMERPLQVPVASHQDRFDHRAINSRECFRESVL